MSQVYPMFWCQIACKLRPHGFSRKTRVDVLRGSIFLRSVSRWFFRLLRFITRNFLLSKSVKYSRFQGIFPRPSPSRYYGTLPKLTKFGSQDLNILWGANALFYLLGRFSCRLVLHFHGCMIRFYFRPISEHITTLSRESDEITSKIASLISAILYLRFKGRR